MRWDNGWALHGGPETLLWAGEPGRPTPRGGRRPALALPAPAPRIAGYGAVGFP
jgi:hypothetical protein